MATITINRQDTYTRTIELKDSTGAYIDASGWTIYFTIRTTIPSISINDDSGAAIAKQIAGDVSGIQTLVVTSAETNIEPGTYHYDFQIKKTDDTISSSEKGLFIISSDVTRST